MLPAGVSVTFQTAAVIQRFEVLKIFKKLELEPPPPLIQTINTHYGSAGQH